MMLRKEQRTCVQCALRNKAAGVRTEFKFIDFDGEQEDIKGLIIDHENCEVLSEAECIKILVDAGFRCGLVKIEIVPEESLKK